MNQRTLGKTGFSISEISLGTWQVGGKWGEPFSHTNADHILNAAVDAGINFIDTADVYGDGESEKAVGRLVRGRAGERIYVATKCGRRLQPHTADAYQPAALRGFVEDSLRNMQLETLDLIQLHCPPTEVYYRPEIFELFDRLKEEGKIQNLGVSVEKVEEGLKAIEFSNVTTLQVIFNMFRQRPTELLFKEAQRRDVDYRAGAVSQRLAHGQVFGPNPLRQRRPPQLQPQRGGVRQGRNLRGRGLHYRPCRRGRVKKTLSRPAPPRPASPALDTHVL
jgi:aryl-alcohol dehydrogenase-like predicted oxidoreductase